AAARPMIGDDRLDTFLGAQFLEPAELGLGIGAEAVGRDDRRHTEAAQVFEMALQIGETLLDSRDVLFFEPVARHAAMHLERPHGSDNNRRGRPEASFAALDVEEFLSPEIGAESGFGYDVVGEL